MADTLTRPSERSPGDAARTDRVDMSALAGEQALVVIRHLEDKQEIATVNGVSDAVSVDLLVVDGQYAGTFEEDRLIFNIGVRNVLWGASDSQVFAGRLIWKDTKTGRQAVVFQDASEHDMAVAAEAWAKRPKAS